MGAISSEIVHLLKVKLALQNDQRWLLLLSWFSKFFGGGGGGGGTPGPPFQISKYVIYFFIIYFSIQHCSTQAFVEKRGFQLEIKNNTVFPFLICD